MRFKDVFSIIGPSMVGPSRSHTAGAVRIGRAARRIVGAFPDQAEIVFYGSFAETYRG
ncbi:L-serine ammonia-lyase, iron-sulfur-dependent, subunit beta, partial [Clostridium perfringens]|nr:L-serine ammonia-lyase, iron-sulfur-dependent, subunit beta [Clostridium perfringens]